MTQIAAKMSRKSLKCAVWPFGTHRDPQNTSDDPNWRTNEPKVTQMCSLTIWHTSRPSGTSDDPNWRTNEPKLTQMCRLAIWHTSRPSGTSDDPNWRTNEPKLTQMGSLAI